MSKLQPPKPSSDYMFYVYLGIAMAFVMVGGFGGWAAIARINSAVPAQGVVSVETNRKRIQHLEGGIVEHIAVQENGRVKAGDLLVRLRPLQATAQLDTHRNNLQSLLALEARLQAEQAGSDRITFDKEVLDAQSDPDTARAISDQTNQFRERRALIEGQVAVLEARIRQIASQSEGIKSTNDSLASQVESLEREYKKVKPIAERGYYSVNRLAELERRLFDMRGRVGQSDSEIKRNEQTIAETRLQILSTRQKFAEEVSQQLRDARLQVAEVRQKLRVAADIVERLEVRAPLDGVVQNLQVHTIGGVVRPGEPMMEVVPANDTLLIHARVPPLSRHYVQPGLLAEVRFTGIKTREVSMTIGTVRSISADQIVSQDRTAEPYFLTIVEVPEAAMPAVLKDKVYAGLPAEVLIVVGDRTVGDYLLSPLIDAIRTTWREPS